MPSGPGHNNRHRRQIPRLQFLVGCTLYMLHNACAWLYVRGCLPPPRARPPLPLPLPSWAGASVEDNHVTHVEVHQKPWLPSSPLWLVIASEADTMCDGAVLTPCISVRQDLAWLSVCCNCICLWCWGGRTHWPTHLQHHANQVPRSCSCIHSSAKPVLLPAKIGSRTWLRCCFLNP